MHAADTAEGLVSIRSVAKHLGCSIEWVRRLEERGVIPPAMRLNGQNGLRVYRTSDLDAMRRAVLKARETRSNKMTGAERLG